LATVSEKQKGQTRNKCNEAGYESVALIPIRTIEPNLGLIHLADPKENMAPLETIQILERASALIGTIIKRILAMQLLQESEQRFRLLYKNSPLAYHSLDENGILLEVNPTWLELLGYQKKEVIGKSFADFLIPEQQPVFQKKFANFKAVGKVFAVQFTMLREDKTRVDVEIDGRVAYDENHKFKQTHCVIRDITARKQAQLQQEKFVEQLKAKNQELEDIIHIINHDLNTPIVTIQGFSDLLVSNCQQILSELAKNDVPDNLKNKLTPLLKEDIPEATHLINKSVSKLRAMLEGMVRIARLGASAAEMDKLDMNSLLKDVVDTLTFNAKKTGAKIEIDNLPQCYGDKVQIEALFSNLVSNALKFLDPSRPGIITISGQQDNGSSVYCVQDNGIGIEPENLENIFEIFYRVNPDFEQSQGIGLSIVRQVVLRHNGKAWAQSQPGKGSRFFVSLPTDPLEKP
jgi:PAS domain S-box-containing protein